MNIYDELKMNNEFDAFELEIIFDEMFDDCYSSLFIYQKNK